jgi:hypothetical protein
MKVVIGPYKSWIGPYQIANALCFWVKPIKDKYGMSDKPDWVHDFGTWLSGGENGESWLLKVCQWIESKRKRRVYVRIDKYDTWSMDHTLAYMIVPMLKQLKATKHGAPSVDNEDVPDPLRSTAPGARDLCENDWDIDNNHFHRWEYVLDEMIWAFEQQLDDTAENQFYDHGEKIAGESIMDSVERLKVDDAGLKAWADRKQNGYRLFGKYYEALWD